MRLTPFPRYVYGWGDEPTTRAYLALIEKRVGPGMRVADVGGGTGILGLRAAELGAEVTIYEEVAEYRELIERNLEASGLSATVRGRFPDEWDGTRYDLLVANLGPREERDYSEYAEEWHCAENP